jgi:phosphatidylserine/phosphatidylglycerophosphate/cardiolipin synthase-like enzyme
MHGATLHAKMFLVDGIFGCAGSFNFDLWSTTGNLETNIGVFDAETLHTLEEQFLVEQNSCREVTLKVLLSHPPFTILTPHRRTSRSHSNFSYLGFEC